MRRVVANRRQKDLPLVLNKVDGKNPSLPISADNLPIGMTEDYSNTKSSNLGTDRPLQGGRRLIGNGSAYTESAISPFYNNTDKLGINVNLYIPTSSLGVAYFIFVKANGTGSANTDFRLYYTTSGGDILIFEARNEGLSTLRSVKIDLVANNLIDKWLDVEITAQGGVAMQMIVNGITVIENLGDFNNIEYSSLRKLRIGNSGLSFKNFVYGIDFKVNDISKATYTCHNDSTVKLYDSSLGGNHMSFINYYAGLLGLQDDYSFLDEEGYTLSDGITYYENSAATILIPAGVFITKDNTVTSPPFKAAAYTAPGVKADLQYVEKAPSRAKFVESNCIKGFTGTYFNIPGLLTTDTIEVYGNSDLPTCTVNGQLDIANGDLVYGIRIKRASVDWAFYPCTTYVTNPSNYTLVDTLQTNSPRNGTLVNGATGNRGLQDEFHYSQLGQKTDGTPILYDLTAFADGTPLSSGITQDDKSFLNTGSKLQGDKTPRVVEAEQTNRFWTDANNDAVAKEFTDFNGAESGDQDFNDISESDKIQNARKHHKALTGRQLITEKVITNN